MEQYLEKYGNVEIRSVLSDLEALQPVRPEDQEILRLVEAGYDCRRETAPSWEALYHLSHLRGNLTQWLPIGSGERVLEFGADTGQLTGGLLTKAGQVVCLEESLARCRILAKRYQTAENLTVYAGDPWKHLGEETYDWIVAPGLLMDAGKYFTGEDPAVEAVRMILPHVKPGGHLVLGSDNRFGLKYWAGALEPHTGCYFDSLIGYGPTCSKREMERILKESGCGEARFYYPYPERWFPTAIYSDDRLPRAGELNKNFRNFEGERLVLFDERKAYDQIIRDGRYPEFANTFLCVIGPEPEEQIIYCKYSNDRADRFMIRTDIVKTTEELEVRKVPLSEEAKTHIRSMKDWEEILDRSCKKNHISANRCTLRGDTACFEYLQGRTFEEMLDDRLAHGDQEGFMSILFRYRTLLMETLGPEAEPFKKSGTFIEMFGNPELPKAYRGAGINDLDWIFGNLMETKDGVCLMDYEWTFDVQVPMEYLLWRAVSLYQHDRPDVWELGLMKQMGITPEEETVFEEMEHRFQLWLLGGTLPIEAHYKSTAGSTLGLYQLVEQDMRKCQMQIYLDLGDGFRECDSYRLEVQPDKRQIVHLQIPLPEGTRAVRVDPMESTGLVQVRRVLGELGGSYSLSYTHNGRELQDQGILYTTPDPQITIPEVVPGTDRVYMELTVEALHSDTAYACMELLNRVRSAERISKSAPYRFLKKCRKLLKK